jgi:hypothetical protein
MLKPFEIGKKADKSVWVSMILEMLGVTILAADGR